MQFHEQHIDLPSHCHVFHDLKGPGVNLEHESSPVIVRPCSDEDVGLVDPCGAGVGDVVGVVIQLGLRFELSESLYPSRYQASVVEL